jgi:hypothetical protein
MQAGFHPANAPAPLEGLLHDERLLPGSQFRGRSGCSGSLCKPLHNDPYAQLRTMHSSAIFA